MNKLILFSTLAAAGIGLAVSGCDQQEASEDSSVPMQQQGAVPSDSSNSAEPQAVMPSEMAPGSSEPEAMPPAPADSSQ